MGSPIQTITRKDLLDKRFNLKVGDKVLILTRLDFYNSGIIKNKGDIVTISRITYDSIYFIEDNLVCMLLFNDNTWKKYEPWVKTKLWKVLNKD